ncbi:MAG TPA: sugar ABC transporter ATP-binding protein [Amycolatopsis sp.]|nr:sugar ABC transporter ATP-binding protein [Amycolatopsis sp.]
MTTSAVQDPAPAEPPAVIEVRALSKGFGATKAVSDGTFHVGRGEIVALLGENGSGKSTLVKLVSGVLRPDGGEILVDGVPTRPRSPRAALEAGIVTVFQEILCARDCSVLDNVWLGNGSPVRSRTAVARRRKLAGAAWRALSGEEIDLDRPAGTLTLMQQQICVIVRALLREPKLLILDESTSTLDVTLQERLFAELRRRTSEGMACLFISHRMDEVLTVADRFVALRSGKVTATRRRGEATAQDLVRLISGREAVAPVRQARATVAGEVAVRLTGIRLRPTSAPFDAEVRAGDVIGLAGLEGHGQDELIKAIAGLGPVHRGEVLIRGRDGLQPVRGYRRGVAGGTVYIPRDRKVEGMADVLPILDNYGLPTLRRDQRFGLVRPNRTRTRFRRDSGTVNFVPGKQESIGRLSGGNQQKVIIARWLAAGPRVILLNDPTRGVDQKTKHELYAVFRRLAEEGAAVVMLSSEVDELVHLMDRVLVFHDGSLSAELEGAALTSEALVSAYFGASRANLQESAS